MLIAQNRGSYKVVAILNENEKIRHFKLTDTNEEFLTNKVFKTVAEAIDFYDKNYKGLLDV